MKLDVFAYTQIKMEKIDIIGKEKTDEITSVKRRKTKK